MDESLRQQPLPHTIAEYKNHPLYALQRHLLKFEALYPPNPDPVGFTKGGEPVFPRQCVHVLHSRDIWLKKAKSVKVGEEPYKVVTARPKWDRVLNTVITDKPLDIFGEWQVEDYRPPDAKDGKVPRNEYGNVEMYQPSMLPGGCVHLDAAYEDINRVARKLGIDCAPAMVGFDFHKGFTHPVFDGYVVCQEFRDTLVDAWREEKELKAQREELNRLNRIYGNWKKLIQGILVKNHVREKYGTGRESDDEDKNIKKTIKATSKGGGAGKSKKAPKKKIKQGDIDAARAEKKPEPVQLGIDLTSDTVEMAKKSLKDAISGGMTSKSDDCLDPNIIPKPEDIIADSDEEVKETEEEKKIKLQKILAWNDSKVGSAMDLSDDSDDEDGVKQEKKVLTSFKQSEAELHADNSALKELIKTPTEQLKTNESSPSDLENLSDSETLPIQPKKKKMIKKKKSAINMTTVVRSDAVNRRSSCRLSRASKTKATNYKESEESDVSLGESDLEDKTYKPEE